jgi:two-component system KDP operon response regulator KdpE
MNCSNGSVLVIDDESSIRRALRGALSTMGFLADEAASADQGIDLARRHRYDAILLDINMPGKCGFDTCRELRRSAPGLGILMVTARDAEEDMVQALAAGADDYIVKPFSMRELTARLRAIRRGHAAAEMADAFQIRIGDILLDPERRSVTKSGASLHLTPKEFDVMEFLMRHAGAPVRHKALLNAVWGSNYGNEVEYLRNMMRQLRLKIEDNPSSPRYLTTEPFIGYRFAAQ